VSNAFFFAVDVPDDEMRKAIEQIAVRRTGDAAVCLARAVCDLDNLTRNLVYHHADQLLAVIDQHVADIQAARDRYREAHAWGAKLLGPGDPATTEPDDDDTN
jgi:hypothetical protein